MAKGFVVVLVLLLALGLWFHGAAEELTFAGEADALKWAEYINSNLPRKVNDPAAQYWTVGAKSGTIVMQRAPSPSKPNYILPVTALDKTSGKYSLGPEGKADGGITFVLAPGCHTGFRCRIIVPGKLVASLGAGYFNAEKPLEHPAFYVDLYEGRDPVLAKDHVPVQSDNPKLTASPVALRISRKGKMAEFSYDHDVDGNFTVLHQLEVGAEAAAMFGIDGFEDRHSADEYLIQKVVIKGVTRNE